MKMARVLLTAAIAIAFTSSWSWSQTQGSGKDSSSAQAAAVKPFLGRWDLTLMAPNREYPSWLEIERKDAGPAPSLSADGVTPGRSPRSRFRASILPSFLPRKKRTARTTWCLKEC